MAKKKQNKSKKLMIKISWNQSNAAVTELDDLNKPLKFPDSPVPAVGNNENMGHLCEAVWSADDEEDQLIDDDEETDKQEVDIESNMSSALVGPELTFVNVNPSAFSASSSHKRKQAHHTLTVDKGLRKPSGKKQKLHGIPLNDVDEEIDQLLLRKLKKTSVAA
ncbi:hypothetical protein BDR04DRAFT_1162059 [Suillus decipiens]|nr:hypothetical protein BDR04DRAFT_1162059 [Suillus decipiens]